MKLYSFFPSKEKKVEDFLIQSQNGLSTSIHSGGYLVVVQNEKRKLYEMHYVRSNKAKILNRGIAFAQYPATRNNITIF